MLYNLVMEALPFMVGLIVFMGLAWAIYYQFTWRPPVVPGYLEEWDMMADFEPDTRTLQERIDEQKRLLKFQGLVD